MPTSRSKAPDSNMFLVVSERKAAKAAREKIKALEELVAAPPEIIQQIPKSEPFSTNRTAGEFDRDPISSTSTSSSASLTTSAPDLEIPKPRKYKAVDSYVPVIDELSSPQD